MSPSAFNSGDFSDFTISCGELTFKVHKMVLASCSEFFSACFRFPGKEADDSCINLPEDDPQMVRRMVIFFYHLDYDPTSEQLCNRLSKINHSNGPADLATTAHPRINWWLPGSGFKDAVQPCYYRFDCPCYCPLAEGERTDQPTAPPVNIPPAFSQAQTMIRSGAGVQMASPLTIHASMYALAEKYQSRCLMLRALKKFKDCVHDHWNTPDFIEAVVIGFSSTQSGNRGMRDAILDAFRICVRVDISKIPGMEERLENFDEPCFHLLKSWPIKV
ncbi:hypothetical protein K458DRAFT_315048 [Lentithecium fluviatile CBS 122367]|uniref:BTB domain-containing protein n=1 Tax=Lentithecium fluviatile CBS 122367 TaxID=1168545 RepID=A0A6G1ILW4_9PLEO|nr:hypothetical protein K458DRAFT_315048 [Lentithecium fluviatile CBS 122367]